MHSENKNHSHLTQYVSALILLLVLAAGAIYFLYFKNLPPKVAALPPNFNISGQVDQVSPNGFTIKETVDGADKVMQINITAQTVFRNSTLGATSEQIKSGKPFKPTTQITPGSFQDLHQGLGVRVTTVEDLNIANTVTVTAKEINYIEYDFKYGK